MVLFFSDIHFGQGGAAEERAKEAELIACLRAHAGDVEHLYLVGDVFDEYIEYHSLVPKGAVRFLGLLAEWTDRGVGVTYLVGNHDPWHRDYFARELGVRVVFDPVVERIGGRSIHLAHGDGPGSSARYRRLKPVLRHPVPVWLYRSLLPADSGLRLARWVKRTFGNEGIHPETVERLRRHARAVLTATTADTVVMGHSHAPERHAWPEGVYVNLGSWHESRTFGRLDNHDLLLMRWNGTRAVELNSGTGV